MALIGAVLHKNSVYERVAPIVQPEHFYNQTHGRIFETCGKLIGRGEIADPRSLKNYFDNDPDLVDAGGASYLMRLAGAVVTTINVESYAHSILGCWKRRRAIVIAEELTEQANAFDVDTSVEDSLAAAQSALADTATVGTGRSTVSAGEAAAEAINRAAQAETSGTHISGIATGFRSLDRLLGGFEPGDLIVVAARPSMGKSAFALWTARNVAMAGIPVDFYSQEMPALQLGQRLVGALAGLTSVQMRIGDIGDAWTRVFEAQAAVDGLAITFDDKQGQTVAAMHMASKRRKKTKGLGLVIIDHLGFVPPVDTRATGAERLGLTTRAIKAMAKDLQVPVILLHQLSRATETGDDPRPDLHHLRGSGDIEQDADVVAFVFRESYYLKNNPPRRRDRENAETFAGREADWQALVDRARNRAEIIVRKQRNGPTGTVRLFYDERLARFQNLHDNDDQPEMI